MTDPAVAVLRVLVLRGEAGVGKTALLDHAALSASGMRVARVAGVESEMELGFAALHQLLVPFLPGLRGLPVPQRQALDSAFGLATGRAPGRFLVSLAALTLLAQAALDQPLLVLIDDAQWLDQESAGVLAFIGRRLYADRIAMLFSVRASADSDVTFEGLPELRLRGLPKVLAGDLLRSAAAQLRLGEQAAAPAETAGLLVLRPQFAFRHPLVRSAVYHGATGAGGGCMKHLPRQPIPSVNPIGAHGLEAAACRPPPPSSPAPPNSRQTRAAGLGGCSQPPSRACRGRAG